MSEFAAVKIAVENRPSHWRAAPFRRVAAIVERPRGNSDASALSLSSAAGVVSARSEDARQQPSKDYLRRYWRVDPGLLVVNPMWLIGGAIGVSDVSGAVSPDYRVYRLCDDLHPRYVHHLLRSQPYFDQYRLLVRAETTFDRRITKQDFHELPVLIPPLEEQRAIADYLDAETARIDALIAKKRRLIELLGHRWRSAVAHRMKELTDDCGAIQLRHLVQCLDGRRVPLSTQERSTRSGPYPYYGASGVVDHLDDFLFDETLVLLGEDGAQLGVPDYPVAQVATGKVWVNNHAHVLRPVGVDPEFLTLHLNTFDRVPFISGGTREKITQDDMNRIPVPHLTIGSQHAEATRLGAIRARCDSVTALVAEQIELLVEHRQALITAAVTGELAVPGVAA